MVLQRVSGHLYLASQGKRSNALQPPGSHYAVQSNGNVTRGILSILSELPIINVNADDLPALVNDPGDNNFALPTNISSDNFIQLLTSEGYTLSMPSPALIYIVVTGHLTTAQTTTQILRNTVRHSTIRYWISTFLLTIPWLIFLTD